MSAAYWEQWNHAEIAALHGAEVVMEGDLAGYQDIDKPPYAEQNEQGPVLMPYDLDMLTARCFL